MLTVHKSNYMKEDDELLGRIWEIWEGEKLLKTVCFHYGEEGRFHVAFYISQVYPRYAVVFNNEDWDLMCFALDYNPEHVLQLCEDHIKWVTAKPHSRTSFKALQFANEEELMQVIS